MAVWRGRQSEEAGENLKAQSEAVVFFLQVTMCMQTSFIAFLKCIYCTADATMCAQLQLALTTLYMLQSKELEKSEAC